MPELPEVETVRRGLLPVAEGRTVLRAEARRPDLRWPLPKDFRSMLEGRQVRTLDRRGKYLLWRLSDGMTLISHLGMSGQFLTDPAPTDAAAGEAALDRHDHVILLLGRGEQAEVRVRFRDPRRFGAMDPAADRTLESHPWLCRLGPEPFGENFTVDWLARQFHGRRSPVKSLLLDQRIVAGIGNIYASEAAHQAGIAPMRPGGRIGAERLRRLHGSVRAVLADAIAAGGSSLRDFRHADGRLGYFQHRFAVYGREGQPCQKIGCAGVIRRRFLAGRSTFDCPRCQR